MLDAAYIPEILLRGATLGILLLSALLIVRKGQGFGVERMAALFLVGTASYVILSAPILQPGPSPLRFGLLLLAMFNSVFFWWFATALFDDDFRWKIWRLVPFFLIGVLFLLRQFAPEIVASPVDNIAQQVLIIAMMCHALWLALSHRNDDLLEQRRRFRLVFAAVIGLTGLIIAFAEIAVEGKIVPMWLTGFHAGVLFVLTFGFFAWILRPNELFAGTKQTSTLILSDDIRPEDRVELSRLSQVMDGGIYRQEGLTINLLASEIKIPEHRLRRLINQQLGFRNFTAFLNKYRLSDAVETLEDPEQARRQITQIAFDLGYGSIAPFNRAFKAMHGVTPTHYRHTALSQLPTPNPVFTGS